MLELLAFLRDKGFQRSIISGGGVHFVRTFAEDAYGIPPKQVLSSSTPTEYDERTPSIMKLPDTEFVDHKAGKPVGIDSRIGRRRIFASGNSDGDFQMLDYTMAGERPRFAMIPHHTNAKREFAYDRDGHVRNLSRELEEGPGCGWVIMDMARDWEQVWP